MSYDENKRKDYWIGFSVRVLFWRYEFFENICVFVFIYSFFGKEFVVFIIILEFMS